MKEDSGAMTRAAGGAMTRAAGGAMTRAAGGAGRKAGVEGRAEVAQREPGAAESDSRVAERGGAGRGGSGSGAGGASSGAFFSAESCNGIDDDGDSEVDELGSITCGVGTCARTLTACTGGRLAACVPGQPVALVDGCNQIDDDCDGGIDEDCTACVQVAPGGNDAAGAASNGLAPFATIQAAIDFASAHSSFSRVCVAQGPSCGATFTYPGPSGADLTMRDGVDVLANYESTAWTRCTSGTTRLAPQTGRGVVFPADVRSTTVLDGFTVDRFGADTSIGVTIDGGREIVLSNLIVTANPGVLPNPVVPDGTMVQYAYGVNVIHAGQASIFGAISRVGTRRARSSAFARSARGFSWRTIARRRPTPSRVVARRSVPECSRESAFRTARPCFSFPRRPSPLLRISLLRCCSRRPRDRASNEARFARHLAEWGALRPLRPRCLRAATRRASSSVPITFKAPWVRETDVRFTRLCRSRIAAVLRRGSWTTNGSSSCKPGREACFARPCAREGTVTRSSTRMPESSIAARSGQQRARRSD